MDLRFASLALLLAACGPPEAPREVEEGPRYCELARKLAEEGRCLEAGEQLAHCQGKGAVEARAAAQENCAPQPPPDPEPSEPVEPNPEPAPTSQPPGPAPTSQPPRPQPPTQPTIIPTGSVHRPQPFPPVPSRIPPFPMPKPPDPLDDRH